LHELCAMHFLLNKHQKKYQHFYNRQGSEIIMKCLTLFYEEVE